MFNGVCKTNLEAQIDALCKVAMEILQSGAAWQTCACKYHSLHLLPQQSSKQFSSFKRFTLWAAESRLQDLQPLVIERKADPG